jgi:hypothetical protein
MCAAHEDDAPPERVMPRARIEDPDGRTGELEITAPEIVRVRSDDVAPALVSG